MKPNMNSSRDDSMAMARSRPVNRSAFSLVELLVVIAITTILLGLLFGPIISSFNLTRRARAVSQAQDAARFGLERLSRELGRATYIYDNGLSPVAIPMNYQSVATQSGNINIGGPALTDWPTIKYARIDLIQAAVRENPADIIDPTNGQPVGGAELQPGVRGKRVVRYFLGLRNPGLDAIGNQRLYGNRYEFASGLQSSRTNNPVILYRAEYDPKDPNLFDTDPATYSSTAVNSGGFNDPAFFYATKTSNPAQKDAGGNPANGNSYSANWQAISQPVLVSENVDLLRWNRAGAETNREAKDANDPFSPTTTFSPVSMPGEVAAPGSLSSGGTETTAAVPTLYQTKYAAWAYPYKIVILRGSTNYSGTARAIEPFGQTTLTVDRDASGNVSVQDSAAAPFQSSGSLTTVSASQLFTFYSPTTHKLFIKTPRLTFAVDVDRGRIETAFPPYMGELSGTGVGTPYYLSSSTGKVEKAIPGLAPQIGELVPTLFSQDTRDPGAGANGKASNLGIFSIDLFAANYQAVQTALVAGAGVTLPAPSSPLFVFGDAGGASARLRGVRIIPGSERITAPIADGGLPTSWTRVIATNGGVAQPLSMVDVVAVPPQFTKVIDRNPDYSFDFDIYPTAANADDTQIIALDAPGTPVAGSNSAPSGMTASVNFGVNFVTGTYLWQNNYSRDPNTGDATWGNPLDAAGGVIAFGSATRPEADLFRVDYVTRQQYNINLGARIYDPTDGRAQTIQVTDKVVINNALR